MTKKVKNQHYVPQVYLRHFTVGANEQIAMFDKQTGNVTTPNIRNVAAARYFNDFEGDDILQELGEQPMESYYSTLEGEFAKNWRILLRNLEERGGFSVADKKKVSHYMHEQQMRTPQARRLLDEALRQTALTLLKKRESLGLLRTPPHLRGIPLEKMVQSITNDPANYVKASTEFMDSRRAYMEGMFWTVLTAEGDVPFITSDAPVQAAAFSGAVALFYPISPKYAFLLLPHSIVDQSHLPYECQATTTPDSEVANFNRLMFLSAERFAFANSAEWPHLLGMEPDAFEEMRDARSNRNEPQPETA